MTHRRHFLKTALAAATAPSFIPNLRAASPNGKIRHVSVGVGGMGGGDLGSLAGHPSFELVAAVDVHQDALNGIKGRFPNARIYKDWREMFEKEGDKFDSMNVSTPDHMHGPIGIEGVTRGKHLYGQKPLTQNLWECRTITELAREKKVMTQMGIQVSSDFSERFVVAAIQAGAIGKIKEVHSFSFKKWGDLAPKPDKADPVPGNLDWDHWLGVAAERPFINGYYHPSEWRKRRDFGTGTLGDMGCHMFSGWFRALALGMPISVKASGPAPNKDNWAINSKVEYIFPGTKYSEKDKVQVTWYDGDQKPPAEILKLIGGNDVGQGSIYVGTEGVLYANHQSSPVLFPKEKFKDWRPAKLEPRDHYHEFLNCIRDGKDKPSANFDYSGPMTEAVLLGCLASAFPDTLLEWDGPKMEFKGNAEATKLVKREYRKGWEIKV